MEAVRLERLTATRGRGRFDSPSRARVAASAPRVGLGQGIGQPGADRTPSGPAARRPPPREDQVDFGYKSRSKVRAAMRAGRLRRGTTIGDTSSTRERPDQARARAS